VKNPKIFASSLTPMPDIFQNPFTVEGIWLKGNLNTHTIGSDGVRTPQEAVDHYAQNGYDFLAITDHGPHEPQTEEDTHFPVKK
jgi:hypothetical protein